MSYLPVYKKYIDDKNKISANKIVRNKFYLLKEYTYANGEKETYELSKAPIIYTIFVSKAKDIIHSIKVSDTRPDLAKKFFGSFYDDDTGQLTVKGKSSGFYQKNVKKFPSITSKNYRTYNISGIGVVFLLDIDLEKLSTKQTTQKPKIQPKPKVSPKPKITSLKSTKK